MAGDPSWNSVSLLLHGNGANGSSTFPDSSPNPLAPTLVGAPTISTSQSKYGGASMHFGGSADALQYANTAALNLATGDFTIEAWIYITSLAFANCICQKDQTFGTTFPSYGLSVDANGAIHARVGSGTGTGYIQDVTSAAGVIATAGWHHVAFVRSGTNLYLFADGALVQTATQTGTPVDGGKPMLMGRFPSGGGTADTWFAGYIDDFRITKGVARYTAAFTPPAAQMPDGMGQVSGTVKDSTGAGAARLVRAFRRDLGTLVAQRYSAASDPNFGKVSLLIPGDYIASQTSIVDVSYAQRAVTPSGDLKLSLAHSFFGKWGSMVFDGASDYLRTATSSDFSLWNSSDWTIELNANVLNVANTPYIWQLWIGSADRFALQVLADGSLSMFIARTGASPSSATVAVAPAGSIVNGTDYHIAVTRQGTTTRVFINGALMYTGTPACTYVDASCLFELGGAVAAAAAWLSGYLGQVRITAGLARYTAAFTPPGDRLPDHASGALGDYSFYTPTLDELTLLALDNATSGTIYDDVCERVIPA